jgi:NAD(P)H-hydrate epimerase
MRLYEPESVYRLDKAAVDVDNLSAIELMQRAGRRVWQTLQATWPGVERITVFAGSGNNGGDAFVVAQCALREGVEVQMLVCGDLDRQSDTARHFRALWERAGGRHETWRGQPIEGQVVVDGLLGIGLKRELDDDWQALIAAINACGAPRLAIDIPSGLNGRTGVPQPVAVEAQVTVTFIGAKTGQWLADGPDYCGELIFDALGMSESARRGIDARLETIESCRLPPPRRKNTHKNHYGSLLIVGGDRGMSGAVALAARAALRSGAGLVTALVHPECRNNLAAFPEIMVQGWEMLEARLPQASLVIVGPGLGGGDAARQCLQQLQSVRLPMVIDASALRAGFLRALESSCKVITPHPGEAAALLAQTSTAIQSDRLAASEALVSSFGATCVLKGSGTLVAESGAATAINTRGNAGMASAGMGDVLCGIIGALMGQGLSAFDAARSAVFIHALCAEDYCARGDPMGLIAGDVIERIPRVIRRLRDPAC